MNLEKEIITIHNYKDEHLGIKVFFATDFHTNQGFVIIADVNPASSCYYENIAAGDILVSINGIEINSLESLKHITKNISEMKYVMIEMLIIKKGILDGSDLIKRCINCPCSELCEYWNKNEVRLKKKSDIPEKSVLPSEVVLKSIKYTKCDSVDSSHMKVAIFPAVQTVTGKSSVSNSFLSGTNQQKALPMKKSKKQGSAKFIIKSKDQNLNRDMIPSPAPQFIKRPTARIYPNADNSPKLKSTKSCINISNISDPSDTSSSSTASSPSFVYAPRKNSLPTNEVPYRPTPMPRTKRINLTHQRSLQTQKFAPSLIRKEPTNYKESQRHIPNHSRPAQKTYQNAHHSRYNYPQGNKLINSDQPLTSLPSNQNTFFGSDV